MVSGFLSGAVAQTPSPSHVQPQPHAFTLTDDRGVAVRLAQVPQRAVSLLPSLTESVCALGRCGALVGVDRNSNAPPSVRALPQAGSGIDPNIEAIVALRPDVVLAATSASGLVRLQALGLPVIALKADTTEDLRHALGVLGQLFGVPETAQTLWQSIDAGVAAAARTLPPAAHGLRVYFEVGEGYAAGPRSFIGETLARLGARNIVAPELGAFPKFNPEYVVRADPDVIIASERTAADLAARPGWRGLRALREGHVCRFSTEQSDLLVRPGPRLPEAARLMARCLERTSKKSGADL